MYSIFGLRLQLSKKAQLGNKVQPVQIPKAEIKIKDKAKCRVAGWGLTKTGGKIVDVLQVVDVPFVNLKDCKTKWQHVGTDLPDDVICAGGYGTKKGFCQVNFLSRNKIPHMRIKSVCFLVSQTE